MRKKILAVCCAVVVSCTFLIACQKPFVPVYDKFLLEYAWTLEIQSGMGFMLEKRIDDIIDINYKQDKEKGYRIIVAHSRIKLLDYDVNLDDIYPYIYFQVWNYEGKMDFSIEFEYTKASTGERILEHWDIDTHQKPHTFVEG